MIFHRESFASFWNLSESASPKWVAECRISGAGAKWVDVGGGTRSLFGWKDRKEPLAPCSVLSHTPRVNVSNPKLTFLYLLKAGSSNRSVCQNTHKQFTNLIFELLGCWFRTREAPVASSLPSWATGLFCSGRGILTHKIVFKIVMDQAKGYWSHTTLSLFSLQFRCRMLQLYTLFGWLANHYPCSFKVNLNPRHFCELLCIRAMLIQHLIRHKSS